MVNPWHPNQDTRTGKPRDTHNNAADTIAFHSASKQRQPKTHVQDMTKVTTKSPLTFVWLPRGRPVCFCPLLIAHCKVLSALGLGGPTAVAVPVDLLLNELSKRWCVEPWGEGRNLCTATMDP